ncbi:MAG TPA: 2-C-methyl-D-erythritol 4-phosphate cytidylyltransferase [Planctomycetota bacterium]|jgi:2-C-methyl-D-erythritol 4-phosphate cytidylyltransferase|nr:2-C-methyl-D-erythritol 4-phosphate cytidylyltransferase [Planctomycetota bacterium]OQC19608.1 MAG: 2-C-methyl-D-erythritol 4-phosphate cytidylyltransferase [Planctomycetes bacterium ADurb.Bin069]HNR99020.1 2-C-methyl-D-erythritol 4-phosphate cytidylyltransferase [Planctomycetota bacterium]HNU27250.1 2-C-methyl-D-erythritol 4-phosphate cytidylyltransferase [Planctomycetota bacterium]HOE30227.1 2-C-methyl-D-erythritol 4-phosphate cytidylyltransferase [Planctomycetota bacterium]
MRCAVILAAGGSGTRLGAEVPKAFVPLAGKPLIAWSAGAMRTVRAMSQLIVAAPPGFEAGVREFLGACEVASGGTRRQDSVAEALKIVGADIDLVAVHDAARPLVAAEDVERTLAAAEACGAAILARRVTDTLKEVSGERIVGTADREALWRAETPQIFARDVLQEAFARWKGGLATDEAQMVTAAGYEVRVVQAAHWNPKVTYPADLELLERVIGRRR